MPETMSDAEKMDAATLQLQQERKAAGLDLPKFYKHLREQARELIGGNGPRGGRGRGGTDSRQQQREQTREEANRTSNNI